MTEIRTGYNEKAVKQAPHDTMNTADARSMCFLNAGQVNVALAKGPHLNSSTLRESQ